MLAPRGARGGAGLRSVEGAPVCLFHQGTLQAPSPHDICLLASLLSVSHTHPISGPTAGGTAVTLSGAAMRSVTECRFGGERAQDGGGLTSEMFGLLWQNLDRPVPLARGLAAVVAARAQPLGRPPQRLLEEARDEGHERLELVRRAVSGELPRGGARGA